MGFETTAFAFQAPHLPACFSLDSRISCFCLCSAPGSGVDGEERTECAARGYPVDVTVTTEKLSSAFLVIAEHLPVIIVANSSDVSGIDDIHMV